jgi:hypothetical protein
MFPECETEMKLLKEDIEMNNNHIKLTALPRSHQARNTTTQKSYHNGNSSPYQT